MHYYLPQKVGSTDRGGLQQAAFRGRKPRRPLPTSTRPTHGTDRRVSPQNSGTFARCGPMTFCQFTSGTFGNVAPGTQAINHYRDALVSGPEPRRVSRVFAEYYVIFIGLED